MTKHFLTYLRQPFERRILLGAAALAALPLAASLMTKDPAPAPASAPAVDVVTRIPRGFVLMPIEARNYEALDSILGSFGIVDLYRPGGDGAKPGLVARNVRLLRAPQNPAHFAVLVPEREARDILRDGSTFTVVVKRPDEGGTRIEKSTTGTKRSITYEGG